MLHLVDKNIKTTVIITAFHIFKKLSRYMEDIKESIKSFRVENQKTIMEISLKNPPDVWKLNNTLLNNQGHRKNYEGNQKIC